MAASMGVDPRHYEPGEWLAQSPYNVELRTLHVDRLPLDRLLRRIVLNQAAEIAVERVVEVEKEGRRVTAVYSDS